MGLDQFRCPTSHAYEILYNCHKNYLKFGGLSNTNMLFHSSVDWKYDIECNWVKIMGSGRLNSFLGALGELPF